MHRRSIVIAAWLAIGAVNARAQDGFSQMLGTLGRERSLAEAGVSIIKHYAPEDIDGRLKYAQAKSAFDGLIDQLLADLAQGKDPDVSTEFRAKVQSAVDSRTAFSNQVAMVIKTKVPPGAKAGWPDLLAAGGAVGELVGDLISGGIKIWQAWQQASGARRDRLTARLSEQRWKQFADIPSG